MNVFEVPAWRRKGVRTIQEVMVKPGDVPWGSPYWRTDPPLDEGPYVVHYQFCKGDPEFIGVHYWHDKKWSHRWCEYYRFEWCSL